MPGVNKVPFILLTLNISPSGSVSLPNKLSVVGVSSTIGKGEPAVPSSIATGASFTGVIVIFNLAVAVSGVVGSLSLTL